MVDDPFAQLERCHRKLEERLAEAAFAPGSADSRAELLAFFDRSIRRHEDDEELSLFPRLASVAELAETIATLRREHVEQAALQRALREATDEPTAARALEALRAAYVAHLALEESVLFPAARRALDEATTRALHDEMQARRGGGGDGGGGGRNR